ncbi:Opsin-2 [Gryllus bimaculatus]|nr:Opsin-2 [Gryllus bimaculatus]
MDNILALTPSLLQPKAPEAWQQVSNVTVVDNVPPDMLHLIDAHWYQFPPLNPLWHAILGFMIGCLGFVSWMGNGVVIYIFSTTKGLRTPSNLLVVNLAFSDFLMMVVMSPPMVVNCFYETWVLGELMCQIYGMCGSLFGCASIWTMTMIAMDRYNVIVKGLAGKPLTIKTALLRIIVVWLFALAWTIAPLFGWNRYVPEGNMTACGTDYLNKDWFSRSYILVYSVFVYYLPLFTIIYSYYFIVKVALMTISLWFMAWTPYLVINYMGVFQGANISPLATIWGSLFAKANAVYNPIVYGISHPKYRAALKEKLPCLVCGQTESPETTSQASAGTTNTNAAEKA